MPDIITEIEQGAVVLWDDFLKGVHFLATEAQAVATAVEKVDPGIQQQLQALLTAGENAAVILASSATGGMTNIVAAGAADAETLVANFLQSAMGGSPSGEGISAAAVGILQQASTALQAAIPVAVAKVASSVASAAKPS